jgi:hypothetical protein
MHDAQPTRSAGKEDSEAMERERQRRMPQRASGIHVKEAKNGGYIGTHHFDNQNAGESYRSPEDHAWGSKEEMLAAIGKWADSAGTSSQRTTGGQKTAPTRAQGHAASMKHGRGVD